MESADFAERFDGWTITEKQVAEIKDGRADAIAAFISDNARRLNNMARAFLRKRACVQRYAGYETADLINQLFCDFPSLRYTDGGGLCRQIRQCFLRMVYGGLRSRSRSVARVVSVETPASVLDGLTLADVLPDGAPSPLDLVESAETVEESAPEIFACLSDIVRRGKPCCDVATSEDLRALVEYVFAGYTFAQIKRFAGV